MFELFTETARLVVVRAQEEARRLDHVYIGTEHLLLGLTQAADAVVGPALAEQAVSLEAVREAVEQVIGRGHRQPAGFIPFTRAAKKVMEQACREPSLRDSLVGPEHLLLGLLADAGCLAVQVLVRLGADPARLRRDVLRLLPAEGRT